MYCVKKIKGKGAYSCWRGSPLTATGRHLLYGITVLLVTRHKWTHPALTLASKLVLDLPTPEGRKLSWPRLPGNAPARSRTCDRLHWRTVKQWLTKEALYCRAYCICKFTSADNTVAANSFIRRTVLISDNKFSPHPFLVVFEFLNPASSGSGRI